MGLDAKDRKIYDLLNDKLFIIPENQRKYVWDSKNWMELMDDISLVYKEKINSHFIGSIVLKTQKINDGIRNHYIIIDGQQRISTLSIIFCAIAFMYAEKGEIDLYNGIKKTLFVIDDKGKYHSMISKDANSSINKIVEFLYGEFETKLKLDSSILDIKNYLDKNKVVKNVMNCFIYFYNSIKNLSGDVIEEIIKIQKIIEDINYIDIVAKEDEDAYNIFEILNARGKPLSDFELLRNYLLKYASINEKDNVKNDLIWLENTLDKSVDIFLKHYVTHKYGKKSDNKENRPYKIISKNEKDRDKTNLINDLKLKAKYYDKMLTYSNCSDNEKKIFMFFKQRRQQQFRPIVMGLMHQKDLGNITDEVYNGALNYLYAFFICYNIIGDQTSNKIEDIVYGYSNKLENDFGPLTLNNMKRSMAERIPSDVHMKNSIKNIKYSNKKKAYSDSKKADNVRAIFEVLERKKGFDGELSTEKVNIEHCYPDSKGEDDEKNFTIGNLMLLEIELNNRCNAKTLSEKKKIYKESKLKCPQELVNVIINNAFDIDERSNNIATALVEYVQELSNN
ncbi:MAG: DUF262 domain-containing protein [Bacilli bacterium]|nr:DUF262 domain-containing protein [Bacilli bacterium]